MVMVNFTRKTNLTVDFTAICKAHGRKVVTAGSDIFVVSNQINRRPFRRVRHFRNGKSDVLVIGDAGLRRNFEIPIMNNKDVNRRKTRDRKNSFIGYRTIPRNNSEENSSLHFP
ncbi:hypothetical protein AVEN_144306-1 [Araneus ventricosus]|uniref:Uncharacterized protein n=1 Tax=Araneus ventricosus TaxID=182803 RepID=A0A4Y2MWE2_ARAVE|nr:hypothetical protein AVEN_144306-1 [Araneus ventricosus]